MRIIGGKYRSRRIYTPGSSSESTLKGDMSGFRPTTDRAKETLFNVLNNIIDFDSVTCLDLFAGSGSLGFEAISRGAKQVEFVEHSEKQASFIRKTASELKCEESINIVRSDALKYLMEGEGSHFDIIFADPPYDYEMYSELLGLVLKLSFIVFVLEYSGSGGFTYVMNTHDIIDKKIGITNFKIFVSKD
jgi:16S rRNA (guanine966-N2)-methyltransferase